MKVNQIRKAEAVGKLLGGARERAVSAEMQVRG